MAPRGIGTMIAMVLAGRVASRVDPRMAMGFGILCVVWSIWEMTTWTPDVSEMRLTLTITVQGFGLGFLFIPLQMLAFATLPVSLRTDGAGLFSLARNIGAAIGVSVTSSMLAHNTQAAARRDRRVGHSVQSRAAGWRCGAAASGSRRRSTARRCWTT